MKGKLYGIGIGPGDPELMTLKAVSTIQKCAVIAGQKTAFSIAGQLLEGKTLLECRFAMEDNMAKRIEARRTAAEQIAAYLKGGQDVAFVTLGDPTTYSTYMYVHKLITDEGFTAEIVPGITSYAAAAAALGVSLCENGEALTIIPAQHCENIDTLLDIPGKKVIMKSGKNLLNVLEKLKERGYDGEMMAASRVSMDGERLYSSIEDFEKSTESGYFTVVIANKSGS